MIIGTGGSQIIITNIAQITTLVEGGIAKEVGMLTHYPDKVSVGPGPGGLRPKQGVCDPVHHRERHDSCGFVFPDHL